MAHMILRNLSDSPRGYWDDTQARGFQSSAVAYEIKSGGQILTNWWHPDRASPIVGVLPARTQAKFNDQLDHYFDLRSPGKYEVRAMVRCGFLQGSHLRADLFEVKSDATTIEILSAPSKPASDTMNGRPLKP